MKKDVQEFYDFLHSLESCRGWGTYGTEYNLYVGKESQREEFLTLLDCAGPDNGGPSEDNLEAVDAYPPTNEFSHRFKAIQEDGLVDGGGDISVEGVCYELKKYHAYFFNPVERRLYGFPPVQWHLERRGAPTYVLFIEDDIYDKQTAKE